MARKTAIITTIGVYTLANLVINLSDLDFLLLAFSTRSRILLTVDSPNSFVTLAVKRPLRFMLPLKSSLSADTSFGTDSPVRADVSINELPSIT